MSDQKGPLKGFRPLTNPPSSRQGDQGDQSIPSQSPVPQVTPAHKIDAPLQKAQVCPTCKRLNPPEALTCSNCGSQLQAIPPVVQSGPSAPPPQAISAFCPRCSAPVQANMQFCPTCGHQLSLPAQSAQPTTSIPQRQPLAGIQIPKMPSLMAISSPNQIWPIITVVCSVFTLICFFLPNIVMKINNPLAWMTDGPEKITFSYSSMQYLTFSSPSIEGLGGLGETAANMFNEIDMGQIMYDSADSSTRAMILLGRGLMLILGLITMVAIAAALFFVKKSGRSAKLVIIVIGIVGGIFLIISSRVAGVGFNTGSSDMDVILNSVVSFSNGSGYWGMLLAFIVYSFSGYMRK